MLRAQSTHTSRYVFSRALADVRVKNDVPPDFRPAGSRLHIILPRKGSGHARYGARDFQNASSASLFGDWCQADVVSGAGLVWALAVEALPPSA